MNKYGIVISDVRVTCLNSGRTIDMLQKALPVGKFIVAGFAGDVRAGLALLENLYSFLNSVEVADDELCNPQWVVDNWPTEARRIYQNLGEVGDTHILMLGLKSKKQALGGAIGHLSVFRRPQFMPETQIGGQKTMSIGCGAEVEEYTTILKEIMLGPYKNKRVLGLEPVSKLKDRMRQIVWQENVQDVIKHSHEKPVIRRFGKLLAA